MMGCEMGISHQRTAFLGLKTRLHGFVWLWRVSCRSKSPYALFHSFHNTGDVPMGEIGAEYFNRQQAYFDG